MKVLSDMLSKHDNEQLCSLVVSIVGEKYTLYSNMDKAITYFKNLFYPNGVNGIHILLNEYTCKTIKHISLQEQEFSEVMIYVLNNWQFQSLCWPVKEGSYKVFKKDIHKCYCQDYNDDTSGKHLIFQVENGYVIVSLESKYEFMILARLVREIAFRQLENQQYISFHSSSVVIGDKGYLVIGDSGAGKSTMALALCKYYGAKYVSNDRIMLKVTPDGIYGIPFGMPIKVNYGTLKTLEVDNEYENWELTIPMVSKNTFYDFKGENKLQMLPGELNKYLRIDAESKIKVGGIIMPKIKQENKENYLRDENEILHTNCYYDNEPVFIEDWLGLKTCRTQFNKEQIINQVLSLPTIKCEFGVNEFKECAGKIVQRFIKYE